MVERADDITAPKTPRRMWRRLWIGVTLFVVGTFGIAWIAIDQIGKTEWQRVQAELRALGAPTSFAELDLPTREEIPDEENFGALPLFQKAGTSRPPPEYELWKDLMWSPMRVSDRETKRLASGIAMLGIAADFEAMSSEMQAQQKKLLEDWPELKKLTEAERWSDSLAWWDHHLQPVWKEIDAARELPFSVLVPLNSEFIARNPDRPTAIYHNRAVTAANHLVLALRTRAIAALHRGDYETALRCLELIERVGTLFANRLGYTGTVMSGACFSLSLDIFVQCLWHEDWRSDDEILIRCQRLFENWDISAQMADGLHSELLVWVEQLSWSRENRSDADDIAANAGETAWLKIAPPGWYDLNMAFVLDQSLRHVHESLKQNDFRKLSRTSPDIADEISRLGRISSANLAWGAYAFDGLSDLEPMRPVAFCEAYRRMAITVCAVERYRNRHDGQAPATLQKLIPAFLAESAVDPIDGNPLRYELINDDSGSSYRLWSIAIDGEDNKGKMVVSPGGPKKTSLNSLDYKGDWTWPSIQRSWEYYENISAEK